MYRDIMCVISAVAAAPPPRPPEGPSSRVAVADLFIDSLPLTVDMRRCYGVAMDIHPPLCRPAGASEMTANVDRLAATTGQSVYTISFWTTVCGRSGYCWQLFGFLSAQLYLAVSQLRSAASGQHGVEIDDCGHSEISSNVFVSNILYPYQFKLHTLQRFRFGPFYMEINSRRIFFISIHNAIILYCVGVVVGGTWQFWCPT